MPRAKTKAKVQTVTNTQLGVAVLAAFMAGGLAFAAAPAQNRAVAPKCGVNSSKVVNVIQGCARGQYSGIDYACQDGTKVQHRPGVCMSPAQLNAVARAACANRCNGQVIPQNGTLSINIDNDYQSLRYEQYALAGTEKFLAGRVRLEAANENVEIQNLALLFTANNAFTALRDMENSIDRVGIYGNPNLSDDSLLGMADYASSTVLIENINFQIPQGASHLYIGLALTSVGADVDGVSVPQTGFQIAAAPIEVAPRGSRARGMISGANIIPQIGNAQTNDITITPVKITDIRSDFAGGRLVGGNQTIFSFNVTAESGRNTNEFGDQLSANLRELRLQITTDIGTAIASNTSDFELCRVDSGNCIPLRTPEGHDLSDQIMLADLVTYNQPRSNFIDLSEFDDVQDTIVDTGETVEYIVRGTFSNVTDRFVQIRIKDLSQGGLVYGVDTNGDESDDYTFSDIRKSAPRGVDYPNIIGQALTN